MKNKFKPSAIGSNADMAASVNIGKVYGGYFGKPKNAEAFCKIGFASIEKSLPKKIEYADFGGGQGFLAQTVKEYLQAHGHKVHAIVADSNSSYLKEAQKLGLETTLCNLEDFPLSQMDLITMRAVLHYNHPKNQIAILESARRALKPGGFFIHQVSAGSESNARLRSDIVNLPSLGRAGAGNYHWHSVDEAIELHKAAGFEDTKLVDFAPAASWGPDEQWDRFNTKRFNEAKNDAERKLIENQKSDYLRQARGLIQKYIKEYGAEATGVESLPNGRQIIHYQYPIIVSRK
jgi:SAM-dependent methyltransferase